VQRRLGPTWTERGRPPAGYFTKRLAEDWLRRTLDEARRGTLPGMVRTGATFADACAEYVRYIGEDRGRKASTVEDYRSIVAVHLLPAFGEMQLEEITVPTLEAFQAQLARRVHRGRPITPRTRNKILNVLHGVFARARKVWSLPTNPAAELERHPDRASGDIEVLSPEEAWALIRAADDERDAAVYATAAFTGLRMGELRALRWRDVDFPRSVVPVRASYAAGELSVPKSGKVRSVPMVDEVAQLLAQLNTRPDFTSDDDLVFCEPDGSWLNDDRLRRRYGTAMKRAGLPPTALSRPAPHIRLARDHARGHRRGSGLDGPRRHPDDDALPALPRPRPGGRAASGCVPDRDSWSADTQVVGGSQRAGGHLRTFRPDISDICTLCVECGSAAGASCGTFLREPERYANVGSSWGVDPNILS
jgi:integrase